MVKYPEICQLIGRGVNLFGQKDRRIPIFLMMTSLNLEGISFGTNIFRQTCIFMHTFYFYTFPSILWAFVVVKLISKRITVMWRFWVIPWWMWTAEKSWVGRPLKSWKAKKQSSRKPSVSERGGGWSLATWPGAIKVIHGWRKHGSLWSKTYATGSLVDIHPHKTSLSR